MYLLRASSSSLPLSINNSNANTRRLFSAFPHNSFLFINSPTSRTSSRTSLISKTKPIFCSPSSMPVEVSQENCDERLQECLLYSRAYWVSEFVIAWNIEVSKDCSFILYASRTAGLTVLDDGVEGHDVEVELQQDDKGLPSNVIEKFPHIRDYKAFRVPLDSDVKSLLKCQLALACFNPDKRCRTATGLQLPGVLDELFSYHGPLGAVFSESSVSLYLWAPTAQTVYACIYKDPLTGDPLETVQLGEDNGVWTTKGPKSWGGCYYVYEVSVYHPSTLQVEKCYANDPYARGLSANAKRTLLVNLDSDSVKPKGWENLADEKPDFLSFSDISIYELHVRDFSTSDETVPSHFRGCYLAFTSQDSAGVQHLKRLADAGLTHIHLLPTFQFAGVDDEKKNWKSLDNVKLETLPSDSPEQQALLSSIKEEDAYNWGYNPVLWGVPKGSYASNPNGPYRTLEFRQMVQALNLIGLRVVLDVVYNHLHGSGPVDENSVLDKIVPGYYLRRNKDGNIEHSTCVNNTASENFMVERLIIDDLLSWAVEYKVDGFRFDLMGHLMKRTMAEYIVDLGLLDGPSKGLNLRDKSWIYPELVKAKSALHSLTKERDGVDGTSIFIYGEGWDFGEVANNGRGINASQFNLPGTGIGSFNDRIRDAILGGSPFGHPLQQGFATGLSLQINEHEHGPEDVVNHMLAASTDHIQVGMAANLKDYVLTNCEGKEVKGSEISTYGGVPVAYALCPTEIINYVSAHDNETLFDIVSLKTSMELSLQDRCRINHLATSIIALSQGIPFFHAGDELLRSKSLDRDSYNSGDWFNRLDFSYNSNNWGVGLPPKEKNEAHWPLMKPRLADPSYKPQKSHILAALENFTNLLEIRYSSPLFRLQTANTIQERVRFHNTGLSLIPGVIVMSIEDGHEGVPGLTQLDPMYSYIVVIINVRPTVVSFTTYALRGRILQLHPVQVMSTDEIVKTSSYEASSGCFTVPPKTTSVFVEPRPLIV